PVNCVHKLSARKSEILHEHCEELTKVQLENLKLKHRLAIIEMVKILEGKKQCTITAITSNFLTDSTSSFSASAIPTKIDEMIRISDHFPHLAGTSTVITSISSNAPKFCDYQCNNAMSLSNPFKADQGSNKSPCDIAQEIIKHTTSSPLIDKLETAGASFINVFLKKYTLKRQRILVDFSSPTIAKQILVGHFISTIIGDWRTRFGMLIAHLEEQFPNFLNENPPIERFTKYPRNGTLVCITKVFRKNVFKNFFVFDENGEFKKRAHNRVVDLQSVETIFTKAWNLICDVSRKEHQKIYERSDRCHILDPYYYRAVHVQFGVVFGEGGKKFKNRSGDTVKLTDLLDEGLKRFLARLMEKERDKVLTPEELRTAQDHNPLNEYVFFFDKMLEDRDNTAVYFLYAYSCI
uniref:Arginyl tRNA synthetase N-terminal domain-containing protein n=1 Tax=Glossina pallidipes TaxID=7398 RepID=A0A1A9Z1Y6_GLOPL